jgi:predicted transcriptional regulator
MPRKTDDNVILQMLSQAKSQKEIAEHFGVSQAAVCKRVKKINAVLKVKKSLEGLTDKQKNFALAIAEGKSQSQAAMESHDCSSFDSAKNLGSQLMARPDIQTAVAELMQEEGLTRRYRVRKLKGHVDHADPNVSLKALDQSWKLDGAYKEEQVHVHMSYDDMVKINQQTKARMKELEEKLGIDSDTFEGEVIEDN